MESGGFGLPIDGVRVSGGSIVVSLVVGMVVTMIGGLAPALRASRVAPLAALREMAIDGGEPSRRRTIAGVLVAAAGVALVLSGTSGEGGMGRAGIGAVVLVIGIVLVGPLAARPAGALIGAPLAFRGVSGRLARRNAIRNPRRTSATAAALLVGVGVVSLFTVFGASVRQSINDSVSRSFAGDLVIEPPSFGGAGLSPSLVSDVAALPQVGDAVGLGYGPVVVDGRDEDAQFTDPALIGAVVDFHVTDGSFDTMTDDQVAMSTDYATDNGYAVGDTVQVGFADGTTVPLTLTTIFKDRDLGGDVMLSTTAWEAHNVQTTYFMTLVKLSDGTSMADGRAALESVVHGRGGTKIEDEDEYVKAQAGEIDTLLNVIYGMLAIAILIALMGIANTLSLSVHERTRELGLLRAVGQTRAQLRSMVRWESVVVATFGAIGGVGLGVFLGWGLVRALNASEGFGSLQVPVGSLAAVLVIGALVGVLAGLRPAWRASKLDVLDAVAAD
jgi:putative ABC transport system permease protein